MPRSKAPATSAAGQKTSRPSRSKPAALPAAKAIQEKSALAAGGAAALVPGPRSSLHERLQFVAARYSQSEIARKTGVLVSNVNRYLKGKKVPAEFCTSLIDELGVNPMWLMTGEGAPYSSDGTAVESQAAPISGTNLLELVDALNAATKMRVGTLAGKEHGRVLRDLNDALQRFQELRIQLNEQTRPVFAQFVDEFAVALDAHDPERAKPLKTAAEQIAALCDDEAITASFERCLARYYVQVLDFDNAFKYYYRALARGVIAGGVEGPQELAFLRGLIGLAVDAGRRGEVRRVLRAVLTLTREQGRGWPEYHELGCLCGRMEADLGGLEEGLTLLMRHLPCVSQAWRPHAEAHLLTLEVRAGVYEAAEAIAMPSGDVPEIAAFFVDFACWAEDRALARQVSERFIGGGASQVRPSSLAALHLTHLCEALDGAKAGIADRYAEAAAKAAPAGAHGGYPRFALRVATAQLARLNGDRARARREFVAADDQLPELGEERMPPIELLGIHYRNATALLDEDARRDRDAWERRQRAREFFEEHIEKGYRCFESMAPAQENATA